MKCPFCIKICRKCKERIGEARLLVAYGGNFAKHSTGKYGFNSICKECANAYAKSDEAKKANVKAVVKWRENNPEYMKQWREDNSEYFKQWYEDNKEHHSEVMKQWQQDNPEAVFNNSNKRRSREENQEGGFRDDSSLPQRKYEGRNFLAGQKSRGYRRKLYPT